MMSEMPKDLVEEVYLKEWMNFVMIENKYYGGNQSWLSSQKLTTKFWADRACGVVAAANVAHYIAKRLDIKGLYPYETNSIIDFSRHIKDVYSFINPAFFGIPTIKEMANGFMSFAKSRDVRLEPVFLNLDWTLPNIINYINKGLDSNTPVMLLTWNTNIKNLKNHWVTITGYVKTKDNKNYVITSNWGRMEVFDLDQWFKGFSVYKGIIYFKITN